MASSDALERRCDFLRENIRDANLRLEAANYNLKVHIASSAAAIDEALKVNNFSSLQSLIDTAKIDLPEADAHVFQELIDSNRFSPVWEKAIGKEITDQLCKIGDFLGALAAIYESSLIKAGVPSELKVWDHYLFAATRACALRIAAESVGGRQFLESMESGIVQEQTKAKRTTDGKMATSLTDELQKALLEEITDQLKSSAEEIVVKNVTTVFAKSASTVKTATPLKTAPSATKNTLSQKLSSTEGPTPAKQPLIPEAATPGETPVPNRTVPVIKPSSQGTPLAETSTTHGTTPVNRTLPNSETTPVNRPISPHEAVPINKPVCSGTPPAGRPAPHVTPPIIRPRPLRTPTLAGVRIGATKIAGNSAVQSVIANFAARGLEIVGQKVWDEASKKWHERQDKKAGHQIAHLATSRLYVAAAEEETHRWDLFVSVKDTVIAQFAQKNAVAWQAYLQQLIHDLETSKKKSLEEVANELRALDISASQDISADPKDWREMENIFEEEKKKLMK